MHYIMYMYTALTHTGHKVTGRQADVIQAAYLAGEIAHRMIVPGGEVRLIYCVGNLTVNDIPYCTHT